MTDRYGKSDRPAPAHDQSDDRPTRQTDRVRRRLIIALPVVALLILVGYVVREPVTARWRGAADPAPSASAVSDPAQPVPGAQPLGAVQSAGGVRAAVHGYRQPVEGGGAVPAGYVRAAAEVEVCAVGSAVQAAWEPWSVVYADGSSAGATGSASLTPSFPADRRAIPPGQCVRGWIGFTVPGQGRPSVIEYQPSDDVVDWAVP